MRIAIACLLVSSLAVAEPNADLTVTPAWLAAHLKDKNLVLLHIGKGDTFASGHIAGARPLTLDDISVSKHDGTGLMLELPQPEDLRKRLEALGISNDSRIVVYFANEYMSPATRVVFTLDAAGLGAHTSLLDGGLDAWVKAGQVTSKAPAPTTTGTLAPLAMRSLVVDANKVLASSGKAGIAIVDARNTEYYDGTEQGDSHNHPHKRGHIKGAKTIPFDSLYDDQHKLRPVADLEARFTAAGVKPGDTVIGYCHIGMQATAMLFAARRLGHSVMLYDGSFEDWSLFHPGYPVEKSASAAKAPEGKP